MNKNINKKTVIGGIIGLLLIYIIISRIDFNFEIPSLPSWSDKVAEIAINAQGNKILIVKDKDKWVINKEAYPADKTTVDNLLKKMKELKIIEKVSDQPFYTNFDLTPEKYVEVIIKAGKDKVVRNIKLGKKSSTQHTFVRVAEKPEVYMVSGTFNEFDAKLDQLRDKDIFSVAKEAITEFEITYQARKFKFTKDVKEVADINSKDPKKTKKVEEWKCAGFNFVTLDKNKINGILSTLSPFKAEKFPDIDKKLLTAPLASFTAKAYGKEISLKIYEQLDPEDKQKKKKIYYGITSESPYVFTVGEWKAKKMFLENIEDLKQTK